MTFQSLFAITFGTLIVLPYTIRAAVDISRARATREQIRKRRGTRDEYDGHEDYLQNTSGEWARAQRWITVPLDPIVAIVGGILVARAVARAIWPGGTDVLPALAAIVGILVAWFAGAAITMALLTKVFKDFTQRLTAYVAVVAAFVWVFVPPMLAAW